MIENRLGFLSHLFANAAIASSFFGHLRGRALILRGFPKTRPDTFTVKGPKWGRSLLFIEGGTTFLFRNFIMVTFKHVDRNSGTASTHDFSLGFFGHRF